MPAYPFGGLTDLSMLGTSDDDLLGLHPLRSLRTGALGPMPSPRRSGGPFDNLEFDVSPFPSGGDQAMPDGPGGPLQWLADIVNKGGRILRVPLSFAATGDPAKLRELGNVIPFSDTLGITNPNDQTAGRDLLEQAGVLDANTPGLDAGDVAGFAVDLLTDPLTFVGGIGAATAKGAQAAAKGALTSGVGAGIRAGEKSLLKLSSPIKKLLPWEVELGTGTKAADFAERFIDKPGDWLRYGNTVGRAAGALLDADVGGMLTEQGQKLYAATVPKQRYQKVQEATLPWLKRHEELFKANALDNDHVRVMQQAAEGLLGPNTLTGTMRGAAEAGQEMGVYLRKQLGESQDVGIPLEELSDLFARYTARFHHKADKGVLSSLLEKIRKPNRFYNPGRENLLKNFPGGTAQVEELIHNPDVWNLGKEEATSLIRDIKVNGRTVAPDMFDQLTEEAGQFVDFVRSLDPDHYITKGNRFFNADPVFDGMQRTVKNIKQTTDARFMHDLLKTSAVKTAATTDDLVNVADLLESGGLKWNDFQAGRGAQSTFARGVGLNPFDLERVGGREQVKGLANYFVPKDIAEDFLRTAQSWKTPAQLRPAVEAYDAMIDLWKSGQTALWPGFHARNMIGNTVYHVLSGAADGPGGVVGPFRDAFAFLTGKGVPQETLDRINQAGGGAVKSADDLLAEMRSTRTIGSGSLLDQVSGLDATTEAMLQAPKPIGQAISDKWSAAKEAVLNAKGPMKAAAAFDRLVDTGRSVGTFTENLGRVAHYIARRQQGYTPAEAGLSVAKFLFDYADLTQAEKQILRRAIPFWTWQKKNIALIGKTMFDDPGQRLRLGINTANAPKRGEGYTPDRLASGLAAPIPFTEGKYLQSGGLPFENAVPFGWQPSWGQSLQSGGEGLISMATPPLNLGYSLISGRDAFTGKNINELPRRPTPFPIANAIIGKTIGRPVTTPSTIVSGNDSPGVKALNLFTGVKVTDLPNGIDAERRADLRRRTDAALYARADVRKGTHYFATTDSTTVMPESVRLLKQRQAIEKEQRRSKRENSPYEEILLGNL